MIVVISRDNKVIVVMDQIMEKSVAVSSDNVVRALVDLSSRFRERWIVWSNEIPTEHIDFSLLQKNCQHPRMMISHNVGAHQFLGSSIGYIEETPFITVSDGNFYPTWQMSGVGAIYGETLNRLSNQLKQPTDLLFFLNDIAKTGQSLGLICGQIPLVKTTYKERRGSLKDLFKFVGKHYKKRWLPFLFFCIGYYDKKWPLWSVLNALQSRVDRDIVQLPTVSIESKINISETVDVLIPTIGREKYLYNVLEDLRNQTHLPQNVIIVEQNPLPHSTSALGYLKTEEWPFNIKHSFIHQTGACNARNIGLDQVRSDWIFLADDDIRFEPPMIADSLAFAKAYKTQTITLSCLKKGEQESQREPIQWKGFGSGCSFVKAKAIDNIRFDTALEHGFGEDADFGNQLRKAGNTIIYNPYIKLFHLKAPVGGFRAPVMHPWKSENPKPSPTVMVSILKHWSVEQIRGYKLKLWSKFYKLQKIKNPIAYIKNMRLRWVSSKKWAAILMKVSYEN